MKNLLLILFFASTSFASSHEKTELDIKTTTPPQEQLFFDDSKKLKRPDLLLFLNENPQKNDNLNFVLKCVNLLSDEDTCGQEFLYELFSYPKFTKLGCINQLLSGDFLNAYIGKKFYWALLRLDPGNEHEKKQTEKAFHKFQERFKEKSTLTLGHTNAQLYYDYASYLYTIQSLNRAIFWMDQSLDMGNIRALKQLGIFYFDRSTYVKEQGLEKSCNDLLSSLFYYKKAIYEAQEDTFSSVLSCFEQLLALSPTVSSCLEESAESTKESLDLLEFYKNSDRLSPYYRKNLDLHYHHRKKVNASLLKLKVKFTQSAYQHLLKVFNFEKDATLKAEGIDDMFWTLSFFAQYFLLYQRDDSLSLENEQILKTAKKYVKVCWKNRETLTTLGGYEYYLLGHYFFHHESENKSLFFFKKSCNYNLALAHHHILMHSLYEKDSVA